MSGQFAERSLSELLDESICLDATTTSGLTNHLPMALVAKAGLGAPSAELKRFADRYSLRLAEIPEGSVELSRSTWHLAVGKPAAYPDLLRFFSQEVEVLGIEELVRKYLPSLLSGISGAAFHGVIRLAYALDVRSTNRVSAALAYLASNAAVLAPIEQIDSTTDSPEKLLRELSTTREWSAIPRMKLISDEMSWVAAQSHFSRVTSSLDVSDKTPNLLAEAALKVYASTDDFTALHGVTGMEALMRIREFVEDAATYDRLSFQALAAAYMTIGAPEVCSEARLSELVSQDDVDLEFVTARAAMSDDEHVAKLVFTSSRLFAATPNPLYLFVAQRAVDNDVTTANLKD